MADETMSPEAAREAASVLFDESSKSPQTRRYDHARQLVSSGAAQIAARDAEHRGDSPRDVFEKRGIWPGDTSFVQSRLKWAPQLEASQALVSAARVEIREAIATARGFSAASWEDIAVVLGYTQLHAEGKLDDPDGYPILPGVAAWRFAATGKGPGERVIWDRYGDYVSWKCWSCTKSVREGHPENGVNAQEGHGEDCARFAREKAAERARWEADDE